MTTEEYLAEVAAIYRRWEPTAVERAVPDPQYSGNEPSQYPENVVAVSAHPDDDARFWDEVIALTKRYHADS